jgi:metal-responsive CopG/Arc/MetJ family transcriptional regulator
MEKTNITITADNLQNLEDFSQILKKDFSKMINEALEEYFANEQKKLLEKNIADENAMTNLDFDEFWDDVEI